MRIGGSSAFTCILWLIGNMNKIFVYFLLLFLCMARSLNGDDNPYLKSMEPLKLKTTQRYVEVRPGAYMFYWFYYADGMSVGADRKPLIIWIQGGPGIAASGLGNFAEIGPLDMNMQPRNHTWIKGRNLLLIDHPVGTGFSYVTDNSLLVKTDREMVYDLKKVIKSFFKSHKQFHGTPSYIFSQSYGGKLCPRLAFYLNRAIEKKTLKMNLKGIGIGSGWVEPKESVLVQPAFLYNMGIIDINEYMKTSSLVKRMAYHIDTKDYASMKKLEEKLYEIYNVTAESYNYENINKVGAYKSLLELEVKINKYVKPTLSQLVNQTLEWKYLSDDVFLKLINVMFVPTSSYLEKLLNTTKLNIAVYNGNLDAVTPLSGASNWVHKLKWHGAEKFRNAQRVKIRGELNGFYKSFAKLSFWSVFKSGHSVPEDNPVAMEQILNYVINGD